PQRDAGKTESRNADQQRRLSTDHRHHETPGDGSDGEDNAETEIRHADLAWRETAHQKLRAIWSARRQEGSNAEPGAEHRVRGEPGRRKTHDATVQHPREQADVAHPDARYPRSIAQ